MPDDDEDRLGAADLLNEGLWREGYVPVSAVIVVAAFDPDTGDEILLYRHDSDSASWKHIGMLTVVLDTYRAEYADAPELEGDL